MTADATKRLAIDQGKVVQVALGRQGDRIRWRVLVSSKRDNGWVDYDAKGKLVRMHKP